MPRFIHALAALLISLGLLATPSAGATPISFQNNAAIAIPAPGSSAGTQIAVSGLGNAVTSIDGVTINGLTASHADDVDLVLVAPTGAALVLMSGAGGSSAISSPISLTFTDAGAQLPQFPFPPGSYKPAEYTPVGSFPSPGPGTSYSTPFPLGTANFTSTFNGINPNGNWSLYTMDPTAGDTGQIANGWSIQISAIPEPVTLSLLALAALALFPRRRAA